ncbi:MAG TPA: dihydrodipicolinate synthase family protein, partial [Aliiroseovarius sp.]|nr:dihydrodipicolinate synthase family protein [Aliiroseovarius sp.]
KILGCSFYAPAESLAFIDASAGLSFDAYHAMPYHPKVSLNQIQSWYGLLADRCSKPLWAYTSGNWAQRMGPDFIAKIKEIPNIGGVKYSSSNTVDVQGAIELQDDDFQVITAVVKTLYSSLCLGVSAATTVEASVFFPEVAEIFRLYEEGHYEEAYAAQRHLNNVLLKYPSPAAKDNFLRVAELKYLLSLQGMAQEYVTDYYRELTESEKAVLKAWYDANLKERRAGNLPLLATRSKSV